MARAGMNVQEDYAGMNAREDYTGMNAREEDYAGTRFRENYAQTKCASAIDKSLIMNHNLILNQEANLDKQRVPLTRKTIAKVHNGTIGNKRLMTYFEVILKESLLFG